MFCCYADLPAPGSKDKLKLINNQSFIGQFYVDYVLNNNYVNYLCQLKKEAIITGYDEKKHVSRYLKTKKESGTMFSVSGFVNKLLSYLLQRRYGKVAGSYRKGARKKEYKENFEEFLKKEAHPIFDDNKSSDILNMLTEPGAEEVDKHLEVMRKIVKTTLFGRWFGRGRETPVCGEPMSKIIKKLQSATSLADLNDVDAKALTVKFFKYHF